MSKLRGLEKDDADVRYSKTLAYLLRHGAEKQGLPMRKDGYVRVIDIVSLSKFLQIKWPLIASQLDEPNLKALSFPHLYHLVESNAKKRFVLFYGFDPSPIRPQRKDKKQGQTKKAQFQQDGEGSSLPSTDGNAETEELPLVPVEAPEVEPYDPEAPAAQTKPKASARSPTLGNNASEPEWFIRAAQGHSIATVTTEHLEPIAVADDEGLDKVGEMVHGSKAELWHSISELTDIQQFAR
jgi:2'-phosphotransferase